MEEIMGDVCLGLGLGPLSLSGIVKMCDCLLWVFIIYTIVFRPQIRYTQHLTCKSKCFGPMDFIWDPSQFNIVEDLLVDLIRKVNTRYGHNVVQCVRCIHDIENLQHDYPDVYRECKQIMVLGILGHPFFPDPAKQYLLVQPYVERANNGPVSSSTQTKVETYLNILVTLKAEMENGKLPVHEMVQTAKINYVIA